MNTFQLTCFLTVAETLSFAKAAKHLNVTQPAVTHQIHSLEEELNAQLFKRTTRSVEITQKGLIFLNDAKNVLNIITLAKKRFEESVADERRFFSIGCHSHNEMYLLPGILREMKQSYKTLHPLFQVVPFQHLYQLLEEEAVDVVLAFRTEKRKQHLQGIGTGPRCRHPARRSPVDREGRFGQGRSSNGKANHGGAAEMPGQLECGPTRADNRKNSF